MLHSIKGKVVGSGDKYLLLDIGPVTLKVFSPNKTVGSLKDKKAAVKVLTYLNISENDIAIYGFENEKELQLFSLLCSVNGIGPKSALSIMNKHDSDNIFQAIAEGAVDFLSQVGGVGRKKAERIILELREIVPQVKSTENLKEFLELEAALSSLGYHLREIRTVLNKVPSGLKKFEDKLRFALKALSS